MASNKEGLTFLTYFKHLTELLETNTELKKMGRGICSQMAWAAGGAGVGGLVAGPPGALLGGIAGSVIGYCKSEDYSSIKDVLKLLSDEEKQNLVNSVQDLVGSVKAEDLTAFVDSQSQRQLLLNCIQDFLKSKKKSASPTSADAYPERTSEDLPPPYSSIEEEPLIPSAPPYQTDEGWDPGRTALRRDPPPPYSSDRIYPDLRVPSTEKVSL